MSTAYTGPIDDILFSLRHVARLDIVLAQGSPEGLDPDLLHALLDGAGRFAETILAPANQAADREGARFEAGTVTTPADFAAIYRKWTAAGWNRISAPAEHGGAALPLMINTAVMEMTTSAAMAFAIGPVLTHCAIDALMAHGEAALQATYLPRLVSGAWAATMNLTEPQAGSDLAQIRTRARPEADGTYRLTGTKIFITYGEHDWTENIIHLVLARLPDAPVGTKGLSLFLVPKFLPDGHGRPGVRNDVRCVGIEHKLGIHGSPTCSMSYGDDGGAVGWLVGAPHHGLACMFTMMNRARVATALQGVAIAERAFQQARLFAAERRQGRAEGALPTEISPIIAHPDIQMMLLTMRSLTAAARAVVYATAGAIDRAERGGEPAAQDRADLLTPIAKAFASEIGVQVASLGIQVHGGTGYVEATGAAQHLRDARITPIYEGTNGIQAIDLVMRKLPRAEGVAVRTLLDEFLQTILVGLAHPALRCASQSLARALADLTRATEWLLAPERTPTEKLAGAGPYLQLFGLVAGTALILSGLLSAGEDDTRWRPMTGLLVFLADHLLADSGGRATAICGAAASLSEALAGLELSGR